MLPGPTDVSGRPPPPASDAMQAGPWDFPYDLLSRGVEDQSVVVRVMGTHVWHEQHREDSADSSAQERSPDARGPARCSLFPVGIVAVRVHD
jgi:hypothetical protein